MARSRRSQQTDGATNGPAAWPGWELLTGEEDMSKTIRVILVVTCALVFCYQGGAALLAQRQIKGWNELHYKRGWLLLGVVTEGNQWASDDKTFERIRQKPSDGNVLLPQTGDSIKLLSRLELVILGFRDTDEENYLESPAKAKQLTTRDNTGFILKEGTTLKVEQVQIGQSINTLKPVWVLVAPHKGQ